MDVIVGTAGHIDHGKTALVKALTGIDADRLPEEKRRGITVDIGFAEMSIGDVHFAFVDVPGHERFVKNMLAGASGIDLVLLVVAADEGVMPQTREHFDICKLLDIKTGIVALTKTDLAEVDAVELAKIDVAELVLGSFLENAPVVSVSSKTGDGLDQLRDALTAAPGTRESADDRRTTVARLPIDRSFTMKGFGTVVTGTLASGEFNERAELELLPERRRVRVRGLQTHGRVVKTAHAGQRVAVNLAGIDHHEVTRGMVLAESGVITPTQTIDVEAQVLANAPKPLRTRQRVRIHIGTAEVLARVRVLNDAAGIEPGQGDLAQLRLEAPIAAVAGERFIIRSYSPQHTIAGGRVIDPLASRHRKRDVAAVRKRLTELATALGDRIATVRLLISAAGDAGLSYDELRKRTGFQNDVLAAAIEPLVASKEAVDANGRYLSAARFERLKQAAEDAVRQFHKRDQLAKGAAREKIRDAAAAHAPVEVLDAAFASLERAGKIVADNDTVRLATHASQLSPEEAAVVEKLRAAYRAAGIEVAKLDEILASAISNTSMTAQQARRLFQTLLDSTEVVKVTDEFYFPRETIDGLTAKLKQVAATSADRSIDVAKFKSLAGVSRKYAIPLLEYFDRQKITQRVGDKRIVL